ncbi:Dicarboxylate/amino acid:cation symporter [Candidatus Trichorickettsia mobilis]|uniref:Dicarboxylate/amino acid:cation symporter n=1 Tax=Candidatus Trichorickettsia mobilis TaxID=1346319 RepID=A0ABZ0UWA0_9RICK|nr:dicarboxylate/amino acid:cation symporter [Candidatus Trichorickettsia mobilis]WPY00892.1 Dicarboxylate/amino acid:cation symporter [Candidatus Trichorickettsia mobilis]
MSIYSKLQQLLLQQRKLLLYVLAISLGIASGLSEISFLHQAVHLITDAFMRIFNFLSLPLIALALIVTITTYKTDGEMKSLSSKTLQYTFGTTIIAATVACVLYILIAPKLPDANMIEAVTPTAENNDFKNHLLHLIPINLFEPFLEHRVISVLLMSIAIAIATRKINNIEARSAIINFFQGWHDIFMVLTKWVVTIIPLALYAFIAVSVIELKGGQDFSSIIEYLLVIILANVVQGVVILPLWLKWHNISPLSTAAAAMPALTIAFFSKSSSGTLPITIDCAQSRLGISPIVAKFILPLCTTINMNGCAAFIFTTVIYISQSNGMIIDYATLASWIIIATIAAIGNAGVPMGCFFLSASLLAAQGVPISLMGIILPFYAVIDMVETALNVWSDLCVTKVVYERSV